MTLGAHPCHLWERGTHENTNGLIRRLYPKKSSFAGIGRRARCAVAGLLCAASAALSVTGARAEEPGSNPLPRIYERLLDRGEPIRLAGTRSSESHLLFEGDTIRQVGCELGAEAVQGEKTFVLSCDGQRDAVAFLRSAARAESVEPEEDGTVRLHVAHSYDWLIHPGVRWHERYTELVVDPETLDIRACEVRFPGNGVKPNYSAKRTVTYRLRVVDDRR